MFLFHLTPDERRAFAGLAKHMIAADAQQQVNETTVLRLMELELGMPLAEVAATPPQPEVLAAFTTPVARAVVLLELLTLAYADGEPHPEEMSLLQTVAAGLHVSEMRLLEMEHWIVRQLALNEEASAFLDPEDEE